MFQRVILKSICSFS